MPRLAILNFFIGFLAIFVAACGGIFLAVDAADAFMHDKALLSSWTYVLLTSAHSHTNLFGLLHIVFGLTLPYSKFGKRVLRLQTLGLGAGTLAMSLLMWLRAGHGPTSSFDLMGLTSGVLLSAALVALGSHCFGLALKYWR